MHHPQLPLGNPFTGLPPQAGLSADAYISGLVFNQRVTQLPTTSGSGTGDVTAAANLTDNAIVRGDGGAKGVQTSTVFVDDSGRLLVNNATSVASLGTDEYQLQVTGTTSTTGRGAFQCYSTTQPPCVVFSRSRGASVGSHTIVQADDFLGLHVFTGSNGSVFREAAWIGAFVDGTPGAGTDMPGRVAIYTSPDGTATPVETVRFTAAQQAIMGVTGSISGPASTVPRLQVYATSASVASVQIGQFANDANGSSLSLSKSRGTTVGTQGNVTSGDTIGTVYFAGSVAGAFTNAAAIVGLVDGTPSGASDMPGRLSLRTCLDGTATLSEAVRIDNAKRMIMGNTASLPSDTTDEVQFQVHGTDALTGRMALFDWSTTQPPALFFCRSRGASIGTHTIVQNGDLLGLFVFNGSNGTQFREGAWVGAVVDGTPGAGADMPAALTFRTSPDGTATPTEGLRIDSAQRTIIGNTSAVTVGNAGAFQVNGASAAYAQAQLSGFAADATTAGTLALSKSRNATAGSNTIVQSGDVLGNVIAYGANGTTYTNGGRLQFTVGTTPGATNDMPTNLTVSLTGDGSGTLTDQFVWTYDGRVYAKNIHNNAGSVTGTTNQYIASGTYTPTLTNVANLDASTSYQAQWMRVGNVVSVSGKVDADPTLAATSTQLGISLPIASNIGAAEDCAGTAFASGIAGQGAAILGDATNDRAQMQWISGDVTNQAMYYHFQYEII